MLVWPAPVRTGGQRGYVSAIDIKGPTAVADRALGRWYMLHPGIGAPECANRRPSWDTAASRSLLAPKST